MSSSPRMPGQSQASAAPVPRAFERSTLPFYVAFAAASAAVCSQINVRLGVTPNTAIIGVLVAIAVGRSFLPLFRSTERQVMVETATSAGGFAGANIALVSLAAIYLLGLERLAPPLIVGISFGMVVDIWLAYRLFGSRAFPADAPWPDGEAVGRVIQAGDEGGRLARQLLQGIAAGVGGRLLTLPAAGVGLAFIGNPVALAALGVGLVIRGHGPALGYDFDHSYLPHGIMIGAGLVQVGQTMWMFWKSRSQPAEAAAAGPRRHLQERAALGTGAPERRELLLHMGAFAVGAVVLSVLAGLWGGDASLIRIALWVGFASLAAFVHTIIVGYCAMLSGWFPSFAVAIALILLAALIGFPVQALALLAGYVLSTGPQFADLGYDLKSGWIIRGRGAEAERERQGRRQQALLQEIGALVGIVTATLAFGAYWHAGLVPPMSRVVAATIDLTMTPTLLHQIGWGALAGALFQGVGGARRAVGILLATGLLLDNPVYGYALIVALLVRWWLGTERMGVRAAGLIAGDGIAGFGAALLGVF